MIKYITTSLNKHTLLYSENLCKVSTWNLQYFFVVPLTPAIQMLPCTFMAEVDFKKHYTFHTKLVLGMLIGDIFL